MIPALALGDSLARTDLTKLAVIGIVGVGVVGLTAYFLIGRAEHLMNSPGFIIHSVISGITQII